MAVGEVTPAPRCLVPVQRGTAGPPVYCFHAFGGSVAPYGELAAHLGRDQLVHGLMAVGLHGSVPPDRSVLDMAYRYAMEIAEEPPAGPSVFLGYSLGGPLALETARLLENMLDEPPMVVAIDADPHYRSRGPDDAWAILVQQVLNVDIPVDDLAGLPREEALLRVRTAAAAAGKLPPRFSLDRLGLMADVCQANERAAAEHRPLPYGGTVVSLRSGSGPTDADSWSGIVTRLVVRHIPGDHHSIMSATGYSALAAPIRELLHATADR